MVYGIYFPAAITELRCINCFGQKNMSGYDVRHLHTDSRETWMNYIIGLFQPFLILCSITRAGYFKLELLLHHGSPISTMR